MIDLALHGTPEFLLKVKRPCAILLKIHMMECTEYKVYKYLNAFSFLEKNNQSRNR